VQPRRSNSKVIRRNLVHTALILTWSDMVLPGLLGAGPAVQLLATVARLLGIDRGPERRHPAPETRSTS
jgi:hypothetical protein